MHKMIEAEEIVHVYRFNVVFNQINDVSRLPIFSSLAIRRHGIFWGLNPMISAATKYQTFSREFFNNSENY